MSDPRTWPKDKPTVEGFYWYAECLPDGETWRAEMVRITYDAFAGQLKSNAWGCGWNEVRSLMGRWHPQRIEQP